VRRFIQEKKKIFRQVAIQIEDKIAEQKRLDDESKKRLI
jgi:hypothetical protein